MALAKLRVLPLVSIEDSVAVLLPEDFLAKHQLGIGDTLYLTESLDGTLQMTMQMLSLEAQLREAQDIMDDRRDALRRLAD